MRLVFPALLITAGCTAAVGLDGLQSDAAGGGGHGAGSASTGPGASASGGNGASGGAGVGLLAADWTEHLGAVYSFEGRQLTDDATSAHRDLAETGSPTRSDDPAQGLAAAQLDPGDAFNSLDPIFDVMLSFTMGIWVRFHGPSTGDIGIIERRGDGYTANFGYLLARKETGALSCVLGSSSPIPVDAPDGSWPVDTWQHLVCRFDADSAMLEAVVDGASVGATRAALITPGVSIPFEVSRPDGTFDGAVDEIFFAREALSDAAIFRIWACGVDGKGCSCDPDAPASYAQCGRASDCSTLAACDKPAP